MIDRGSRALPNGVPETRVTTTDGAPASHRDAGAVFEALVMTSVLQPLARTLGFYGDAVVASVSNATFRCERLDVAAGDAATARRSAMRAPLPPSGDRP